MTKPILVGFETGDFAAAMKGQRECRVLLKVLVVVEAAADQVGDREAAEPARD